jgi:hypothetical protein
MDDGRDTPEGKHYAFNEGMPTGPDVEVLLRTWPEPKVGDTFDYETIARLITATPRGGRFWTVCNAWRRRWLEKGLVIECRAKEAFYVADPEQIIGQTHTVLSGIGRKARLQRRKLLVQRARDDKERETLQHHARLMVATEREAKKQRMNLLPSTEVKALPVAPPKKDSA